MRLFDWRAAGVVVLSLEEVDMSLPSVVKTVLVIIGLSMILSHAGLSSANPALLEAAAAGNL